MLFDADMRKYLGWISIWLGVPLTVVSLPTDVPELTCLAMLYLFVGGACLAIVFFILFFLTRKKPQAVAALLIAVAVWLGSIWNGFAIGARIHLFVNEERYAAKIREVYKARSPKEKQAVCGSDCFVDSKLPLVGFHTCHCPFYWPDLVYDPSGALDANRSDLSKVDFYLHDYRHLTTFWYIGYFGD